MSGVNLLDGDVFDWLSVAENDRINGWKAGQVGHAVDVSSIAIRQKQNPGERTTLVTFNQGTERRAERG